MAAMPVDAKPLHKDNSEKSYAAFASTRAAAAIISQAVNPLS
jgi:acetolactate synthase-1/2/3 large subunit